MTDRLRCIVPFCRHTTGRFPNSDEWICADHWRLVDRETRALIAKIKRRAKRHGWTEIKWKIATTLWDRAKSEAIERAVGIAA